jgi:signal transduction histidine kinase
MNEDITSTVDRITHQIVCLHTISKLLSNTEKDPNDVLNTLVHLLPEGWQHSCDTYARVIRKDSIISSVNYQDTKWKQTADIRIGEETIGTLEVGYVTEMPEADEGPFLVDEKNLLETVAAELSRYLEHKQIERIKDQQHRELDLYASLLRHDLRNDIGVIVGNTEILKMTMPEREESLEQIIKSTEAVCSRMMNLLNAFGRAAKLADTDSVAMIKNIAERAKEVSTNMNVIVNIAENAQGIRIPESKLLPLVFDNLLRNAAVHAGNNPTVEISLSRMDGFLRILVLDDGPGVATEIKDSLFQKGVSTRGGGLGLYLSKHVVETIGGGIRLLDSEPGIGATFEIILPIMN